MTTLKLRKIGNSIGVTLPKEVLAKFNLEEGDLVYCTETPDGIQLRVYDPHFEEVMEAFNKVRKRYRNAFRELAK